MKIALTSHERLATISTAHYHSPRPTRAGFLSTETRTDRVAASRAHGYEWPTCQLLLSRNRGVQMNERRDVYQVDDNHYYRCQRGQSCAQDDFQTAMALKRRVV